MTFWPEGGTRRKPFFITFLFPVTSLTCLRIFLYLYFLHHLILYTLFPSLDSFPFCFLSFPFLLLRFPALLSSFHSCSNFPHFIPFFTSSSLSFPLFLTLLPLRPLVSLPTDRESVRFQPLPRKQGLKFKAALVDWRWEREHRRRPGLGQNRFEYHFK